MTTGLILDPLYTLSDIHAALNADKDVVSERTLERIVREMGFQKGRGNQMLFSDEHLTEIRQYTVRSVQRRNKPGWGFVYVVYASEDGPCKIGRTINMKQRLSELQSGNPHRLRADTYETADTKRDEQRAHSKLKSYSLRGEWFDCSASVARDAVVSVIDDMGSG